ncbi:MAG: hypothetical protein Rubg2KO_03030 [Rubricoccaceae bacterium]
MRQLLLVTAFLLSGSARAQGLGLGAASTPVTDWPVADPAEMGLDTTALADHAALCEASAAVACLVAYKGHIVQEWAQPEYAYGPHIGLASATKSVSALLVGMLIADGHIGSLDDEVRMYLPEWTAGADSSVTLRHLLTMTSGLDPLRPFDSVLAAPDANTFVVGLDLPRSPGTRWAYSNDGVQLLSPILERAGGMPPAAYARERLLTPIGAHWAKFDVDEYGNTLLFGGMMSTLRDFARIGQLVLNRGTWNGRQLVPANWIDAINTPTPQNPGYGLLWWLDAESDAMAAVGDGDRVLTVLPEHDLVAVRLQRIATIPGTASATYFNDRGRMHADAWQILKRVVPSK